MPVANALQERVAQAIGRLDRWLETLRAPGGYGGPISHWWDASLVYAGPMLDWRYEGIVGGYLNLYRASGHEAWLDKAVRAGDDLLQGQRPDGSFWNSCFEFGPATGGTPHEAAADVALLKLAQALRASGDPGWERYLTAAARNLRQHHLRRLWNGRGFADQPGTDLLVANKNATTLEALLLYQNLSGENVQPYIEGAARVVLDAQAPHGPRAGATVHAGTGRHRLTIGIYTARCASALARLLDHQPQAAYQTFVARAVSYLGGLLQPGGTLFGHYRDGRPIAAPRWVSPSGELLHALLLARACVAVPPAWIDSLVVTLVEAQQPSGGLPTASGLAARGGTRPHSSPPDFRDVLPVAGWCDKAFRALTLVAPRVAPAATAPTEVACRWRGRDCRFCEDEDEMRLTDAQTQATLYRWRKAQTYPDLMELWT